MGTIIAFAETDTDIARCFPVMAQLRPKLRADEFVARIRRMAGESYRLAFLADDTDTVRSVAGFRLTDRLHAGRVLYVDDLVTDAASRSCGHGDRLFDWLVAHARSLGCVLPHVIFLPDASLGILPGGGTTGCCNDVVRLGRFRGHERKAYRRKRPSRPLVSGNISREATTPRG